MTDRDAWGSEPGSPYWWWSPSVSVVVVARNEGANVRRTVNHHLATLPANSEVLVVDDGSTDGSLDFLNGGQPGVRVLSAPGPLGVAKARNLGGAAATGHVIVFSDAHIDLPRDWVRPLCLALADPAVGLAGPAVSDVIDRDAVGFGMTIGDADALELAWLPAPEGGPTGVPVLCGMFTAMRREVFAATGGFDGGLDQWGDEDLELSMRLWMLGFSCVVVPEVRIGHLFRETFPYVVDPGAILANRLRIGLVHLEGDRLQRFLDRMSARPGFTAALARVMEGDPGLAATHWRAHRVHDADWYLTQVAGAPPLNGWHA